MNGRKLTVLIAITGILALGEFASAVMIGLGEDGPDNVGWPFAVTFGVFFLIAAWLLRSGRIIAGAVFAASCACSRSSRTPAGTGTVP